MVFVEPALPRGHKLPLNNKSRVTKTKQKFSKSQYGVITMPDQQKVRRLRPEERKQVLLSEKTDEEELMQRSANAQQLGLLSIRKGMLLLGCVKEIGATELQVMLPGRIKGIVPITNISTSYSKLLQNMANLKPYECLALRDLYAVGDLVYMKVVDKETDSNRIILTLDPRKLHETFQPSQLVPGLVLAATITEKEDHGYTMDVGINNVRAFLPQKNLNGNRDDVGRNLFCSIVSVKSSDGAVVTLKAFHPDEPRELTVEEATIETIVPGCQLTFTVGEPVKYGLRGMLFEDSIVAYVNENLLTKVTSSKEGYSMFKRLPATLLYTMPVTNEVFVSLRPYPNNRAEMDPAYKRGTVIKKAYVKRNDANGNVWLQFGNNRRAFLSRRTILNAAEASSGGNVDESFVLSNFQVGTTHKVGVLYFDPLEETYVVTNNPDDTIGDMNDIEIGQTYRCRVVANLSDNGFLVGIGRAKGKLRSYLYDKESNIKIKDTVPMRAVARQTGTEFVYFTNHPLLLDERAPILKDWDQLVPAEEDKTFLGVVCFVGAEYVEVVFFNNMRGRLNTKRPIAGQDKVEVAKLHPGSVKLFTVIGYSREKNQIDLTLKKIDKPISKIQLVNATVSCIHALGVDVRDENGEEGTIPADCFSEFGQHNSLYMRLLREGEKLTAVKTHPGKYSVRLTQYFQEHPTKMADVNPGMLLMANCITVGDQLFVVPLLSDFTKRIPITDQTNYRNIEDGSIVKMRVIDLKRGEPNSSMTIRTGEVDVCEDIFVDSHSFINEYMQDVNRLIERYREQGHAFAHYSIGDKVECVVEGIVPEYNKMAISVNAVGKNSKFTTKGIVRTVLPDRPASSYSVDQKLSGRVVWIDVEKKLLHVCVDEPLLERIQLRKEDETVPKEERECWILFSNYFINVCCVKNDPACSLVIVPVKYHYNDFEGMKLEGQTVNAHLKQELGSMIFGLEATIYHHYMYFKVKLRKAVKRRLELSAATKIPPKVNMVRGSKVPATYDAQSDNSEDEELKEREPSDSIDGDEEDELHDGDESNEEVTILPTSNGNGRSKIKKSSSLSSKKNATTGIGKSMKLTKTEKQILKREVDEEEETNVIRAPATTKEKPLKKKKATSVEEKKKKKQKMSVSEEPEMKEVAVEEEPRKKKKKVSEEPKKKKASSMEEPRKKKLSGLKKKT